jgi:hypothetical protein
MALRLKQVVFQNKQILDEVIIKRYDEVIIKSKVIKTSSEKNPWRNTSKRLFFWTIYI